MEIISHIVKLNLDASVQKDDSIDTKKTQRTFQRSKNDFKTNRNQSSKQENHKRLFSVNLQEYKEGHRHTSLYWKQTDSLLVIQVVSIEFDKCCEKGIFTAG